MTFENPTPLRVGSTGTLNGWRVRVAGRVVMGMEEDGETYYWNEYSLVDDAGNSATLVFEEAADGGEWKLFRAFTPLHTMSAAEAAAMRVGGSVNLDGTPARITLVDQSRVHHIEGHAPEGIEVGDTADYFNVDTGSRMLVVSWSGDDVEYYEGLDAPADSIADAFGIPRDVAPGTASHLAAALRNTSSGTRAVSGNLIKIVFLFLLGVSAFAFYSCFSGRRGGNVANVPAAAPRPKAAAPALQLPVGAQGSLAQHTYVIDAHAVVEVGRVAGRHDWREYWLHDETNQTALLVNALSGGSKEWHLFQFAPVPPGLSPYEAAAKRKGMLIPVGGRTVPVTDLFLSKTLSASGPAATDALPGTVQYGFVARDAGDWVIARWTENQVQFLRGSPIPENDVLGALNRAPEKSK